jgi:hypothetical protein
LLALKAAQYQLYLDLVGDTCHAARGWHYWSSPRRG